MTSSTYRLGSSSTAKLLGVAIVAMMAINHEYLGYEPEVASDLTERVFYLCLSWILGKRALDVVTKGKSSSGTIDSTIEVIPGGLSSTSGKEVK